MTTSRKSSFLSLILCAYFVSSLQARDWSDPSGIYKIQGDLIAASEDTVVLRRKGGELEAYLIVQLSDADREFVKQHLAATVDDKTTSETQTWTGRAGFKFMGRVTGYGSKDVVIHHERGKIYVNQKPLDELDQIYQQMIPKIVAEYDDASVTSLKDLTLWVRKLRGKEKLFTVDGAMMRLVNGESIAVPLFLFSDEERAILEQGWENWKSETTKEEDKQRESFLAQTAADQYQQNQEAETRASQRIQLMQLELLAVNAGVAQLWEVQLFPRPGVAARPLSVVVPAQNSFGAKAMAEQKYPGFASGAVRQISYR